MYYITICTQNRLHLFGHIEKNKMILSEYGIIAQNILLKKSKKMHNKASIISYVIMPNHLHLILEIKISNSISLKKFITTYKSLVTKNINKYQLITVWQRNYYEHIIRNEKELYKIIQYIDNNPVNWKKIY